MSRGLRVRGSKPGKPAGECSVYHAGCQSRTIGIDIDVRIHRAMARITSVASQPPDSPSGQAGWGPATCVEQCALSPVKAYVSALFFREQPGDARGAQFEIGSFW